VSQTSHAAHLLAPQPLQVWSKSGSNKGHFTREAETVFHPYLSWHCKGVSNITATLFPLAPQTLQVCSRSGSKKGQVIREGEEVFHPYLASHCSTVTQTSQAVLLPTAPKPVQVKMKWGSNEGYSTPLKPKIDYSRRAMCHKAERPFKSNLEAFFSPLFHVQLRFMYVVVPLKVRDACAVTNDPSLHCTIARLRRQQFGKVRSLQHRYLFLRLALQWTVGWVWVEFNSVLWKYYVITLWKLFSGVL
jgi:hypothetical protein